MSRKTKITGIYTITNTRNGKRYIGSSVNVPERWKQHLKQMRTGNHHCVALKRAVLKYGVDAFSFALLEECGTEKLLEREQHFFDSENPEYNSCRVAGNTLGIKHTMEQRLANSKRCKELRRSEAWRAAQSSRIKLVFADEAYKEEFTRKLRDRIASTPKDKLREKYTAEVRQKLSFKAKSRATKYEVSGELLSLTEISSKYGVSKTSFTSRLERGWSVEDAATRPVEVQHKKGGDKKYAVGGELLSLSDMARKSGVTPTTLLRRMVAGMTAEAAMTLTKEQAEQRRRENIREGMKKWHTT